MFTKHEKRVCLDINFKGRQAQQIAAIRNRAIAREPSTQAIMICIDKNPERPSYLEESEHKKLVQMTLSKIRGTAVRIDGIFPGGVNVDVILSEDESQRLRLEPDYFISASIDLTDHSVWLDETIRTKLNL